MEKIFVGESEAKAIVRGFMRQYQYTTKELEDALFTMWRNVRVPTTVAKREELLKKKFAKYGKGIICKRGLASFSSQVMYLSASYVKDTVTSSAIKSQAERKKLNKLNKKHHSHMFKLNNQFFHSFIVRNPDQDTLSILMFLVYADNKYDVGNLVEVVNVTKHCLERVIERLNLKSVDAALNEILSGLQYVYSSNRELRLRADLTSAFYRHIPTQNGALLLSTYGTEGHKFKSDLITWIHKKQFFIDQEVTDREFNFVQHVNHQMSNPDRASVIVKLKEKLQNMKQNSPESAQAYILINSEMYLLEEFVAALEKGEYLDFMIDFEKFRN